MTVTGVTGAKEEQAQGWKEIGLEELGQGENESGRLLWTFPLQGLTFWGPFDDIPYRFLQSVRSLEFKSYEASNQMNEEKAAAAGIKTAEFAGHGKVVTATGWAIRQYQGQVLDLFGLIGLIECEPYYAKFVDELVAKDGRPQRRLRLVYRLGVPEPETQGLVGERHARSILDYYKHGCCVVKGCWLNPFIVDDEVRGRRAQVELKGQLRTAPLSEQVPNVQFEKDINRGLVVMKTPFAACRKNFTGKLK